MIICSCQRISDKDVHAAIDWMRAADRAAVITPGKIYHALGKTAECGGCMRLFVAAMRMNDNLAVPAGLRGLRSKPAREATHERRSEGHRLSEQGAAS